MFINAQYGYKLVIAPCACGNFSDVGVMRVIYSMLGKGILNMP